MLKKLSLLAVTSTMGLGLAACNERDVAVGAGAVGGAIVAGAIYDTHYRRDYRQSRGYYTDGSRYWDRYDGRYYYRHNRWYRDPRYSHPRYRYPRYPRHHSELSGFELASVSAAGSPSVSRDAAMAGKYLLSRNAARQVAVAFDSVQTRGTFDEFKAMGLQDQDIQAIARGAPVSEASVGAMTRSLGASSESVQALLLDVRDEYSLYRQGAVTEE